MRTMISRLLDVVLRRSREQRMHDEMQAHLDLLADEYVAQGLSQRDAQMAARKAFGGVDQTKERYRDQRGLRIIE
ncbi:MAG TPA: permease prefix domain 1-containing protein, partial [Vicinamibacterales bacterium]|nr:permease prefix domain 1-containing protein [Vicinamibacterales bacterium]